MSAYLPYIFGALGGGGVICIYYGVNRIKEQGASRARRRGGLWLVNAGVVMIALSLALMIRGG